MEPTPIPPPELRFDHLGLIVPDLAAGRAFLAQTLNITHWTTLTEDPNLGVFVQFGTAESRTGPAYELIAPIGPTSPVATALRSGKNILNHLAYLTADLPASAANLRAQGCYPTADALPAIAYGGKPVQFFVSPLRFIIELIESPNHHHTFTPLQQGRGLS